MSKRMSSVMDQSSIPTPAWLGNRTRERGPRRRGKEGAHDLVEVGGLEVLKVVGVGDLARGPHALVLGVVDERREPLALVLRVRDLGLLPRSAPRRVLALGVRDSWGDPLAIVVVGPLLRLLSVRVGDDGGLVLEPVLGLGRALVQDGLGSVLVPVGGLDGFGVGDLGALDPVCGLEVGGVVDLLGGVDGGGEVLEEGASLDGLVVNLDLEGLVGAVGESRAGVNTEDGEWRVDVGRGRTER